MKEAWKVYIKGVEDRGDDVIKALTDLGAVNYWEYEGNCPDSIYYIRHDGRIGKALYETELAQILMDKYTELYLSEKWKDGDLLVCHMLSGNRYAVYSDDSELMKCNTIITYADVDNYTYGINGLFDKEDFKLASDKEHKEFYELLYKHGVDWDAEKKEVVDWKLEPKEKDGYYYIDTDGDIMPDTWDDVDVDADRYNFGNCFPTKEEAEAMAEKIKKLLKGEQL